MSNKQHNEHADESDKPDNPDNPDSGTPTAGGGAAQPPAPAGDDLPAFLQEASPVTRLLLISGPNEWRCLLCGIDSLDLGFYATWGKDWLKLIQSLKEGKENAQNTVGVTWQFRKSPVLLVMPKGRPMYAYQLRHPCGIIYISEKEYADGYPNVYVSLLAEKIWQLGHRICAQMIHDVIGDLGGLVKMIQVSRVDLAADMHLPGGLSLHFLREHAVTRSRQSALYLQADDLETYYAGGMGGAIRIRIYDKSREIVHSRKLWFCDLWKIEDAPKDVWRVEFQVRRDALKDFGINTLDDLQAKIGGLWAYLTEKWFAIRLHDNDNLTRRTVHPWWSVVQALASDLGSEILIERRRKPDRLADASWYIAHAAGCLAAYAARMKEPDLGRAAEMLAAEMQAHWLLKDWAERYQINRLKLNFDDSEGGDE